MVPPIGQKIKQENKELCTNKEAYFHRSADDVNLHQVHCSLTVFSWVIRPGIFKGLQKIKMRIGQGQFLLEDLAREVDGAGGGAHHWGMAAAVRAGVVHVHGVVHAVHGGVRGEVAGVTERAHRGHAGHHTRHANWGCIMTCWGGSWTMLAAGFACTTRRVTVL